MSVADSAQRPNAARIRLGVNIDHVATIRNARGGSHPDPARAALLAQNSGADGITLHIREDRRHVREADLEHIAALACVPINLELACAPDMLDIAARAPVHAACIVPERREERTTEGGLDVVGQYNAVAGAVSRLSDAGKRVSLFIAADLRQIEAAVRSKAPVVELHTGAFCEARTDGRFEDAEQLLEGLRVAAREAAAAGLEVHAGHGIDYATVTEIARIPEIVELNIGHFLIGEAVFAGLPAAIAEMRRLIDGARRAPFLSDARERHVTGPLR